MTEDEMVGWHHQLDRHEAGRGHEGRGLFWEDLIGSSLVTEVFALGLL